MDPLTTAPVAAPRAPASEYVRRGRFSSFLCFALQRLLAFVFLVVGVTFLVFCLTQLVPSDPAAVNLGDQAAADPAAVAAFEEHYGLDRPLPVRYVVYLGHLVRGDLGQSTLTHQPVAADLEDSIPATVELALFSIVIASVIGIAFGIVSALRRNRPSDHAIRFFSLGGISMPTFWVALVALYVGFYRLGLVSGRGTARSGRRASTSPVWPLHGRRRACR